MTPDTEVTAEEKRQMVLAALKSVKQQRFAVAIDLTVNRHNESKDRALIIAALTDKAASLDHAVRDLEREFAALLTLDVEPEPVSLNGTEPVLVESAD